MRESLVIEENRGAMDKVIFMQGAASERSGSAWGGDLDRRVIAPIKVLEACRDKTLLWATRLPGGGPRPPLAQPLARVRCMPATVAESTRPFPQSFAAATDHAEWEDEIPPIKSLRRMGG